MQQIKGALVPLVYCLTLLALWGFPVLWYTKTGANTQSIWLTEGKEVQGWSFVPIPIGESAEALLVADTIFNGEFRREDGQKIRAFSAKRYKESPNEIGLFVHTPDRCWTYAGWKMERTHPDSREVALHGVRVLFERRIFSVEGQRELVYFGGLVGGQPLPYRLDHNLSVGLRRSLHGLKNESDTALQASDSHFWTRVWDSFANRRRLLGPKQFVRISVPLSGIDAREADALLTGFLLQWLQPVPYAEELSKALEAKREIVRGNQ
jgi:hypothetical protein